MIEIKTLTLTALGALLLGASGGFWGGVHLARLDCNAAKWKADDEALRVALSVRESLLQADRQIAAAAAAKLAETEKEYNDLRRDYAALKKARADEKSDAPDRTTANLILSLAPTVPTLTGEINHAPPCPDSDDWPLSDDLFRLYLDSYRPLMRASP
ncbi:MAG: hypothetical protein FWF41_05585 [Betaproteobacteria bacterium]|nr:hypothetical protein [Betaproteobacteria bacterium]